jgi:Zn finger protein HypA/HybF involved in hydrogenase expression
MQSLSKPETFVNEELRRQALRRGLKQLNPNRIVKRQCRACQEIYSATYIPGCYSYKCPKCQGIRSSLVKESVSGHSMIPPAGVVSRAVAI